MPRLFIALLLVAVAASAQEGFPLDGTWRGEYIASRGAHTTIVLILQWDGKQVTGTINPGPQAIELTEAQLMPEGWKVSFAAKDAKGAPVSFAGVLTDIGKYNRVVAGKWTEGGKTIDIRFARE
jgi:hypothetical protein